MWLLNTYQLKEKIKVRKVGYNLGEEWMELATHVYTHLSIEAVVDDQLVGKLDSERLHGVFLPVEERTNVVVVKVRNLVWHFI